MRGGEVEEMRENAGGIVGDARENDCRGNMVDVKGESEESRGGKLW